MEDFQKTSPADLFYEAVHLSSTASHTTTTTLPVEASSDATDDVIATASALQIKLKEVITKKIPDAVRMAAGSGSTTAVVLEFNGGDKFEGEFSYLFLLKGPRDREQRDALVSRGFVPLLPILQHELTPFDVRHSWTPGTNSNRLTLVWPATA